MSHHRQDHLPYRHRARHHLSFVFNETSLALMVNVVASGGGYGHFPEITAWYELQPCSRSWLVSG